MFFERASGGMADALASGASPGNGVEVQLLSRAQMIEASGIEACFDSRAD